MNYILLSDAHLLIKNPVGRLDNLVEVQFDKLNYVLSYALEIGAIVLIAGDIGDIPRSWYLLPKIIETFMEYKNNGLEIGIVYGQHDTYLYSEETKAATMLGILDKSQIVTNLDNVPESFGWDDSIYGCYFGGVVPKPKKREYGINILVIHAPIARKPAFPNHKYIDAKSFLKKYKGYDLILCGDIHRRFLIKYKGRIICNTGPMVRKVAEDYNFTFKPGFYVYDSNDRSIRLEEIPHQPAEKVLTRKHIEEPHEMELMMDEFANAIDKEVEMEDSDVIKNIQTFVTANDIEMAVKDRLAEITGQDI